MPTRLNFDVDIDFASRDEVLTHFRHASASINRKGVLEKHNTGVYFQNIPKNPVTNQANIDYKKAQDLGYFKVDMLNVGIYEGVRDELHLVKLMKEPNWKLLEIEGIVTELFHIGTYFDLVKKLKPGSVEELAMVLAIIRPSKKYLWNESWDKIKREVWIKPDDGTYTFKKAHSVSYAMAIVVQLNLLEEHAAS